MSTEVQEYRSIGETREWYHLLSLSLSLSLGEIIPMFLAILLYFCTSILTLLNFVEYFSFRAVKECMKRGLETPFVWALKLRCFMKYRGTSTELQEYRSIVRNTGVISPNDDDRKTKWARQQFLGYSMKKMKNEKMLLISICPHSVVEQEKKNEKYKIAI